MTWLEGWKPEVEEIVERAKDLLWEMERIPLPAEGGEEGDEAIDKWWEMLSDDDKRNIAVLSFFVNHLGGVPPRLGEITSKFCLHYINNEFQPSDGWSAFKSLYNHTRKRAVMLMQLCCVEIRKELKGRRKSARHHSGKRCKLI